ncbi:MAG TPA: CBS domain-containing protein [Caldithrix abyssi]|uniref:CBS domain-containing protein n=1 Tax=Caldithrix abyssi TaxID=187145 RepID=A0A7V4TZ03_CALAY|nr:CBS domain-containing protein [Caldithrix abyssi]
MQTKPGPFNYKKLIESLSDFFIETLDKARLTEHGFVLLVAVVIGLLGGYGAVFIQHVIKEFHILLWKGPPGLEPILAMPWYWKIAIPTLGGIVVGLIIRYWSAEAKGHGVPEVMEAIALKNGVIRPRVVFAKLLASAFYIASGGSVGREGPVIQIGSAVGSTVGQFFKVNPKRMRTFVACGAASGIAAAFNAPVAGALFAVEIILGDFAVPQFSPIVISSVTATIVSRHYLGDFPAFEVPAYNLVSPLELINYLVLGLLAGFVALGFIKMLYASEEFFDRQKYPDYVKGAIGGIIIGVTGLFFPQIFGVGYDTMDLALSGQMIWQLALGLILIKMFATSISLGSGGSGGIFAPSLFLGAMLGAFYGQVIHQFFPDWTASAGAYALVAMGGVVGAATHGPIAAILIIFEMTNDYKIILPLMITTIIATLISTRLQKESIYTLKLVRRGIDIFAGREVNVLRSLKVSSVVKQSIELVDERSTFTDVLQKIVRSPHNYIYVTDTEGKISGYISMHEIRQTIMDYDNLKNILIAQDLSNPNVEIVRESDNLDYVMKKFGRTGLDEMPVLADNGDDKIVGTIWQTDVISTYNQQIFLRDMSGEMGQSVRNVTKDRRVHVVKDYHLEEIETPSIFLGKTLKEIELRKKYNVELLLIRRKVRQDGRMVTEYIQPQAKSTLQMNDTLLVFGKEKDLHRFENL